MVLSRSGLMLSRSSLMLSRSSPMMQHNLDIILNLGQGFTTGADIYQIVSRTRSLVVLCYLGQFLMVLQYLGQDLLLCYLGQPSDALLSRSSYWCYAIQVKSLWCYFQVLYQKIEKQPVTFTTHKLLTQESWYSVNKAVTTSGSPLFPW